MVGLSHGCCSCCPWHTITRVVPFGQISSLVLDLLGLSQAEMSLHLPWVPCASTSTQNLVPAQGDVAEGV